MTKPQKSQYIYRVVWRREGSQSKAAFQTKLFATQFGALRYARKLEDQDNRRPDLAYLEALYVERNEMCWKKWKTIYKYIG